MNYFIRTFGIWKNNISTKFHKIFIKHIENRVVESWFSETPLEKSILAVTRITRDYFIRNQIFSLVSEYISWLNEGFKKESKFKFLAQLYAKQYDFL